ncbi:hypothetical protein B0H65DRAFT_220190 [Neurospora tetraspora]|uniref:Uncharacterized protein n=1 Tax=Neurospora tetraspora TaxID=94610 RepID=A0AAE0MQW9_9PEZI|nr:hypothetical protein B0H65DRAFT_220190 [Neurospora tetraspora]
MLSRAETIYELSILCVSNGESLKYIHQSALHPYSILVHSTSLGSRLLTRQPHACRKHLMTERIKRSSSCDQRRITKKYFGVRFAGLLRISCSVCPLSSLSIFLFLSISSCFFVPLAVRREFVSAVRPRPAYLQEYKQDHLHDRDTQAVVTGVKCYYS